MEQTNPSMQHISVERQFMQLVGTNIRTFDQSKNLLSFAKTKAFKLKEEVAFYSDEAKSTVLFSTKARNIIDFSPTFDVFDSAGQVIVSLKRDGLSSAFARDHWVILSPQGETIGDIQEDSAALGIIRRYVDFVSYFLPQVYTVTMQGATVGEIRQRKNPFTVRYDCEFNTSSWESHRALLIAIPNLLAIIEARQN